MQISQKVSRIQSYSQTTTLQGYLNQQIIAVRSRKVEILMIVAAIYMAIIQAQL